MKLKELPPQLRDRITQRHRCGEGGKKKLYFLSATRELPPGVNTLKSSPSAFFLFGGCHVGIISNFLSSLTRPTYLTSGLPPGLKS